MPQRQQDSDAADAPNQGAPNQNSSPQDDASGAETIDATETPAVSDPMAEIDLTDPSTIVTWIENNQEFLAGIVINIALALVLLIAGLIVSRILSGVVLRATQRAKLDLTLSKFFARLTRWIVLLIFALFILGVLGIETASFAVVIGAAGLAIGLAFQGTLSNFASGIMLLIFRPFRVGQYVSVSGISGTVDEIGIFTTTFDTPDKRRLIVPNSSIFGSTIENVSHHQKRRVDVAVGTEYSADLDKTRAVLMSAAETIEERSPDEEIMIYLNELGGSSINWAVRVWAPASEYWPVREKLTRAVKIKLDEAGIGIPFPQMDVHVDGALAKE